MKLRAALVVLLVLCCGGIARASAGGPPLAADEALQLLKAGNARYAAGRAAHPNQDSQRRTATAKSGQHPFAAVLGCSDARVPPEIVFDQGVGDLFVVRSPGNVVGPDETAGLDYAVRNLGALVVLVLGDSSCDVVNAALRGASASGPLAPIVAKIRPAVAQAKAWNPMASGEGLLRQAVKTNVWLSMATLLRKSPTVRDAVLQGRILLEGAVYDVATGRVTWLGQHPEQGRILAEAVRPAAVHAARKKAWRKAPAKAARKKSTRVKAGAKNAKKKPRKAVRSKAAKKPAPKAAKSGGDMGGVLPPLE